MVLCSLLIACAGLSAVLIINQGANQSFTGGSSGQLFSASHQIVATNEGQVITLDDYVALKKRGISNAIALIQSKTHLYLNNEKLTQRRVSVLGLDYLSLMNQSFVTREAQPDNAVTSQSSERNSHTSSSASQDDMNSFRAQGFSEPRTLIHPKFMQELGIDEGHTLYFDANASKALPQLLGLQIEGLADTVVMDIGEVLALDPKLTISRILLLNKAQADNYEQLSESLPSHLSLEKLDLEQSSPQMTESFYLNLMAMALLMFAVCLFIVMNACNLLIFKRFAMLKVFRQLGIGRRQIIYAHAVEFTLFAILISALGLLLGSQLAVMAAPTIRNIVEGLYRVNLGFADNQWLSLYIRVLGISLAGVALALVTPIRQLNQSLSQTQAAPESPTLPIYLTLLAAGLGAVAALIFTFSADLSAMLVAAACLIFSGCCLLIAAFGQVLKGMLYLIPNTFTLTRLTLAQSLFLSKKTKIACCAFFIAATSNIGMNLMVDSFRSSTVNWLEQRLVAEHYLYSQDSAHNLQLASIAQRHDILLHPRYEAELDISNTEIFSYPVEPHFKQAMVFESAQEQVWELFEQGRGILVNQQFAIRNTLTLGDSYTLVHPNTGEPTRLTVTGIIYDYGNPKSQILLPISAFVQDMTQASVFAVSGTPDNVAAFVQSLKTIGIDTQTQFYQSSELVQQSIMVFDRTFLITDSLNLVTLLVAALSLACTIVILMQQSRPQTMLLRTLGISAWQGRGMLLLQYMFLCLVALIAATPFGILLSYVLIEQINYHAFNWSYPLIVDWTNILELYLLSLLIVLTTISLPIIYSTKQSIAEELKWLD